MQGSPVPDLERLNALARSGRTDDREQLIDALAAMFDGPETPASPRAQALLSEIFLTLVRQAERDVRKRLVERLAPAIWVPLSLIQLLSCDEIEIARPVIAQSPLLRDADLIRLMVEATLEHRVEVARRPRLGAAVVDLILERQEPAVITALAGNQTAEISDQAMTRLVAASERVAAAREPLTRHPRLTAALARSLYGWVGDALRANLAGRFSIDDYRLAMEVGEAVLDVAPDDSAQVDGYEPDFEREARERKLLRKLQAAGELRPSYLLKALREGRLSLFIQALAILGGHESGEVQAIIDAASSEPLAMACTAIGLDRSVFPTVLQLVRGLNAGRPGADVEGEAGPRPVRARPTLN